MEHAEGRSGVVDEGEADAAGQRYLTGGEGAKGDQLGGLIEGQGDESEREEGKERAPRELRRPHDGQPSSRPWHSRHSVANGKACRRAFLMGRLQASQTP